MIVPAKPKFVFNPQLKRRIPMGMSSGFPDFIVFISEEVLSRVDKKDFGDSQLCYSVVGIESKMNGTLDKQEKEKVEWLLQNNIFSRIFIAQKGQKRGEIIYKECLCGVNG